MSYWGYNKVRCPKCRTYRLNYEFYGRAESSRIHKNCLYCREDSNTHKDYSDLGYLYIIISPVDKKWIKVGKTKDPDMRLKSYNSSLHEDTIEYYYLSNPMYSISNAEGELLEYLRKVKDISVSKREWFSKRRRKHLLDLMMSKIIQISNKYQ